MHPKLITWHSRRAPWRQGTLEAGFPLFGKEVSLCDIFGSESQLIRKLGSTYAKSQDGKSTVYRRGEVNLCEVQQLFCVGRVGRDGGLQAHVDGADSPIARFVSAPGAGFRHDHAGGWAGAVDTALGQFGPGVSVPLPLPRMLTPRSIASEGVDNEGRFSFDAKIRLPLGLGRLVRCRGWLVPVGQP